MEISKLCEEKTYAVTHEEKRYTVIRRIQFVGDMETPEEWEVLDEDGEDLSIQPNKRDKELSDKLIDAVQKAG